MCVYDDDESAEFWQDEQPSSQGNRHYCAFEQECNPDEHNQLIFDVAITSQQLLLASALIGMLGRLTDAHAVIEAAWSLREFLGMKPVQPSAESHQWNDRYEVGTVVEYFPQGRNGEQSYLGRTSSPAIDTQAGAVVLIEGHKNAVSLLNVIPRTTTSPEVML